MRPLFAIAALALGSLQAPAPAGQTKTDTNSKTPAQSTAPTAADSARLTREIDQRRAQGETLPDASSFTFGDRNIPANQTIRGTIAVANGNLDVYGTIDGDAVALGGDVRVHNGGHVTGDAFSAGGSVVIDGGVVEGERRALTMPHYTGQRQRVHREPLSVWQALKLAVGWFAIFAIIGIGVMLFADANLDGVVVELERGFARSFWIGVAGQLLALPGLLIVIIGLAITVLGLLLVPFAIVAYIVAAAGLLTLGFLAAARVLGGGLAPDDGSASPRGVHLRALFVGLIAYLALWVATALFSHTPGVGPVLRVLAVLLTWVAATAGLGATIGSRAGTHRSMAPASKFTGDELAWQTPTPVTGVAASARRPVSSTR
jgi:hypothetical protein